MQHAILTLIRHGETTGNLNRLLQGVTDSPLTVFGQAQVDALARTWATTRPTSKSADAASQDSITRLDLPPPTLIVCSPIGRARKTATAIYTACTSQEGCSAAGIFDDVPREEGPTRLAASKTYHAGPGLALIVDPGLAEKDFGWKESTRGGTHVAGFPKGSGSGESRSDFLQKVHRVGSEWLQAAATQAQEASQSSTPHIVLVSHGMWISTFLSAHPPTTISQTSGQPGFLPFAANTGIFSLKVQAHQGHDESAKKPITDLFRANDIRHLANVKRQRGGIGRGAFDSKQTKLSSFFQRPVSKANDDSTEASPPKKRKT